MICNGLPSKSILFVGGGGGWKGCHVSLEFRFRIDRQFKAKP